MLLGELQTSAQFTPGLVKSNHQIHLLSQARTSSTFFTHTACHPSPDTINLYRYLLLFCFSFVIAVVVDVFSIFIIVVIVVVVFVATASVHHLSHESGNPYIYLLLFIIFKIFDL